MTVLEKSPKVDRIAEAIKAAVTLKELAVPAVGLLDYCYKQIDIQLSYEEYVFILLYMFILLREY